MRKQFPFIFQLVLMIIMTTILQPAAPAQNLITGLKAPAANKIPKTDTTNGDTRVDNYFWLREKKNPAVIAYLEAENAYTGAAMKPTEPLQQKLYTEMLARIKQTDQNVPYKFGDYYYYARTVEGQQYPIYCRKHGNLEAQEEVTLGSDAYDLVYEDKDELYDLGAYRTRDKALIVVQSESKTTAEARYIPADRPTEAPHLVLARENDHKYFIDHRGDLLYIRTNKNAKNYRLVSSPLGDTSVTNWQEVVPHRPEVKLDDFDLFANHLVLSERTRGLQTIQIIDLSTHKAHELAFPEPVYTAALDANREFNTNVLRFRYQSLTTPNSVFDYDMTTRERKLLKQTEVLGGYNPANYTAERVYATATDGTKIPISLVYRKGMKRDGKSPMLLYGYGSYGISIDPNFNSNRVSLLDRGVIYAIAHIRGGGELGEDWREAGRMMKKKTTFTDFINCAEDLIKQK